MKREIKFRMWDTVEHEMLAWEELDLRDLNDPHVWNFQKYPIMQFTGLKDKNGGDIYEGDRVFDPHAPTGEQELFTVKYIDELAAFKLTGEGDAEWDETDWEVYDNIYDLKPTRQILN